MFGATQYNPPSRFLDEIPSELVTEIHGRRRASRQGGSWGSSGASTWGNRGYESSSRGEMSPSRARREAAREHRVDAALHAGQAATEPIGAAGLGLRVGDDVRHAKWGEGVILDMEGSGDKAEALIRFPEVGEKRLLLAWAPLERA